MDKRRFLHDFKVFVNNTEFPTLIQNKALYLGSFVAITEKKASLPLRHLRRGLPAISK